MKLRAAYVVGLLLAALAVGAGVTPPPGPSQPGAPAPAAPKQEEPAKITGLVINRGNGGFLGLEIEDNHFKLSFYDAKKKHVPADVSRATMRWPVKYQPSDERTVLNPTADGKALTSSKFVHPPYVFKVFISLFVEGNEDPVETYVVDYRE